jgi:hypothetical protein
MTDILVRGRDRHTDKRGLRSLRAGRTKWFWRGRKPRRIDEGRSGVYFVDQGHIYAWAVYEGYKHKSGSNLEGHHQSGGAIGVRGPARSLRPPIPVPPAELRGQWRWRYITPTLARQLRRSKA